MIKDTITHSLQDAVKSLGLQKQPRVKLDIATRFEFGHYSSNIALLLAPLLKKSPQEVGEMIRVAMAKVPSPLTLSQREREGVRVIEKVEVAPAGFINFFLLPEAITQELSHIIKDKHFGVPQGGKGTRVLLEYSQPNTHKEFHVGHVRNVALGAALVNLYEASGYNVTPLNYIGDIGNHVAKCLWGLQKWYREDKSLLYSPFAKGRMIHPPLFPYGGSPEGREKGESKGGFNKGRWLGEIYTQAAQEIEAHPEYKAEVDALQRALEGGDKQLVKLWKQTRLWSLAEFNKIYKELGIHFDHFFYESEVEKQGRKVVADLQKRGIAQRGEGGAIMVNLEAYKLGIFLLLKSDGASLYATKDLALASTKFKKYQADISLHVVDERQSLYFKQLFKTLQLAGFKNSMMHVPYAFVKIKQGIMSSRKGNVIRYEDIRDALVARAAEETKQRHPEWSEKKLTMTAHALVLGAMKFGMLRVGNEQVITFDIQEALSFDGFTGPYLQYSLARMTSIFKKAGVKKIPLQFPLLQRGKQGDLPSTLQDQHLIFLLTQFPDMVTKAREAHEPSVLAKYLFEVARAFSSWYEACPVLTAEPEIKKARLALLGAAYTILSQGLTTLGIPLLKEM